MKTDKNINSSLPSFFLLYPEIVPVPEKTKDLLLLLLFYLQRYRALSKKKKALVSN